MYEVSGRITDADNIGIGGVTVSAGASQATTDATGNYHVTGIEAGTVNLTPAKPGYTFCPKVSNPHRAAQSAESRLHRGPGGIRGWVLS